MIKFILNDKIIETSARSGMTLLDFIRDEQQLKGTKIACREGDCGACTVLSGTLENNEVVYKSITSCISPLGNAAGKHIVTIEGLNLDEKLSVPQQVMADNHGTQCGFCSPGIIVSMTGYALGGNNSSCKDAISGNICRCTGYKSIEKAADVLENKLEEIESLEVLVEKGFVPEYFKSIPERLEKLNKTNKEKKQVGRESAIVANGTDIYVRHADRLSLEDVRLIGEEKSLKGIVFQDGICTIGASTTVADIFDNQELNKIFPKLKAFLKLVSSAQIRNMGTIGGNFVNASPIGDMSIFFLALNSVLHIKGDVDRNILFKDFHQDYKKYDLQKAELITALSFNIPDEKTKFNFEKVSKRTHLDIASVNAAASITVLDNVITNAIFSMGGVAAIPKLLEKTNLFLKEKKIAVITIKEAEKVMQTEISPIDDIRGTSSYKRLLARQLFFAHFVKLFPKKIKLEDLI